LKEGRRKKEEGRRKKEEGPTTAFMLSPSATLRINSVVGLSAPLRSGYEEDSEQSTANSQQSTVNSQQSTVNSQLYKNRPQLLPAEEWCFKINESEKVQANPVSTANPKG
jgi:hypothetical protein